MLSALFVASCASQHEYGSPTDGAADGMEDGGAAGAAGAGAGNPGSRLLATPEELWPLRDKSCTGGVPEYEGASSGTVSELVSGECSILIPVEPMDMTFRLETTIVVAFLSTGVEAFFIVDEPGACASGLQVDREAGLVLLCDETCARLQAEPAADLEILIECDVYR